MAVQMPFAGFSFMHRLVRIGRSSQRHPRHREILLKLAESKWEIRTFSTGSAKRNENEREDSDSSQPCTQLTTRQALLVRRRRPLSPLERISSLLPEDALSPEVMQLREQQQQEPEEDTDVRVSDAHPAQEEGGRPEALAGDEASPGEDEADDHHASDAVTEPEGRTPSATLPGERSLTYGEQLVAECFKKGQVAFRKMFTLQTGSRLESSSGIILHDSMAGQPAGRFLETSRGVPMLIRRASLEDYAIYMRRAPAITYPKDAVTMLMMMDVSEGDCVLESGSGSGAMSLFLSRAVGSKGRVLSVEVREDHLRRAKLNYKRWRTSWSMRRGEEWPDNVEFHSGDLRAASPLLAGRGFHAIALDLLNPHLVLPTVIPHLHPGAVCAIYLANITQVVDLLEGIRCSALPLFCETVVEVPVRHWVVTAALQKSLQFCTRKPPPSPLNRDRGGEGDAADELEQDELPAFGSVPYVARPHPAQLSHSAFLVKLRKHDQ